MVDTKKLLEQAKAYDTSRGVIAAAPVNPAKRTSASAGGVDTAKLLAQAKAYDAAKSADPKQAAQTAPNTPVAKGSFTGNRKTTRQEAQPNLMQRLVNILTGAAKSTGSGVVNALGVLSDVSDSYDAAKKNMGVTTHADEERATMYPNAQSGQRSTAELYDIADRLQQQSAQNIGAAKQGLGKVGSTLVDVGVAGAQMAGDAVVNLVAPGAGLAALGTRAFGNASQEARQMGATLAQQIGYGAAVGGIEVLTEKMFNGLAGIYGKGTADEVVENVIKKLAKTNGGQNALRVLSSAADEGIEEIVAGLTEPALQSIFDKQSIASHYDKSTLTDALHDAIVGGILGGLGGGYSVMRSGASANAQNTAPQTHNTDTAQIPSQIPRSAENGGNLTGKSKAAPQGEKTAQSAQEKPSIISFLQVENGKRVPISMLDGRVD